ncbi:MAG: hypothetical protein IJT84_05215 [Clostridia bacterium]|nr:hypothetical protein [Clostridia bacterium]
MPRYIDADKLMKEISHTYIDNDSALSFRASNDGDTLIGKMQVIDIISDQSTADVQEVKHGKWELSAEPLGQQDVDCAKCSLCGELFIVDEDYDFDYIKDFFKYCPNCGAKMDGDRKNEQRKNISGNSDRS